MLLPVKIATGVCNYVLVLYFMSGKGEPNKIMLREEDLEKTLEIAKAAQEDQLLSYYFLKIPPVSCMTFVYTLPENAKKVPVR